MSKLRLSLSSLFILVLSSGVIASQFGSDDFNDGSLDPEKWMITASDPVPLTVSESGGTLNFQKSAGTASDGIVRANWIGFPISVKSDFSVSVDFHIEDNVFANPDPVYQHVGLSLQVYKNDSSTAVVFYDFLWVYEGAGSPYSYIQAYKALNYVPEVAGESVNTSEDLNLSMEWNAYYSTISFGLDGVANFFPSLSLADFNLDDDDLFNIKLTAYSLTTAGIETTMSADNFLLTTTVPEPATLILVSSCLLAFFRKPRK